MGGRGGSSSEQAKAGESAPAPAQAPAPASAPELVCNAGKADCDDDAADGCETSLSDDAKNCGACGLQCDPSAGAVASCDQGKCMQHVPRVGKARAGARHGGEGGSMPLRLVCEQNQVMVGAAFTVDRANLNLVKVEPRCAPFELEESSNGELVARLGEIVDTAAVVPSDQKRTVRDCAAGTVVTAVGGLVEPMTFADGQTVTVVSLLALGCSKLTFGPGEQVASEDGELLQSALAELSFGESCPEGQAVVGLVGASDTLIGWLQMLCAPIVSYQVSAVVAEQNQ